MPLAVQLSQAKGLGVNENARLFALLAMATADAMVAVVDAKYHYEFWRPIIAIRNGDIDGNPQTDRDPAWDSLGPAPLHPEYPCAHCIVAHCIVAGTAGTVMQAFFGTGTLPEFSLTTPTAPGVTHRWTRLEDLYPGALERPHLVRHPLPFLDQGGHGHGEEGRRLHRAELPPTLKVSAGYRFASATYSRCTDPV